MTETAKKMNAAPRHLGAASHDDLVRLETLLSALAKYLNAPGDWGYGSVLADLTAYVKGALYDVRRTLDGMHPSSSHQNGGE